MFKVGDRVRVTQGYLDSAEYSDDYDCALVGLEGVVGGYGIMFDYAVDVAGSGRCMFNASEIEAV